MNEILYLILAFIVGITLGIIFFGGLWFTVKNVANSKIKAFWIAGSFLLRISITLLGFYYISAGNLQSLLICLLGFVIARFIIMRVTKSIEKKQLKKEVNYET